MEMQKNASMFIDFKVFLILLICRRLGVIGAGLMGAGIANVSIDQGIETVINNLFLLRYVLKFLGSYRHKSRSSRSRSQTNYYADGRST